MYKKPCILLTRRSLTNVSASNLPNSTMIDEEDKSFVIEFYNKRCAFPTYTFKYEVKFL